MACHASSTHNALTILMSAFSFMMACKNVNKTDVVVFSLLSLPSLPSSLCLPLSLCCKYEVTRVKESVTGSFTPEKKYNNHDHECAVRWEREVRAKCDQIYADTFTISSALHTDSSGQLLLCCCVCMFCIL